MSFAVLALCRAGGCVLLLCCLATNPLAAEADERVEPGVRAAPARVQIDLRDARLSVDVKDEPWAQVLGEVQRKTGIVIRARPQPDGVVSASFKDVDVEEGLRRLAGPDRAIVFHYETASAAVPSEVWILASAALLAQGATRAEVQIVEDGPGRSLVPAIVAGLRHRDAAIRRQAAGLLGGADNGAVVGPLEDVVRTDLDSTVRASAVAALARIESPRAVSALAQALDDQDPTIRIDAITALAGRDGDEALTLLRGALRHRDADVQRVAAAAIHARELKSRQPSAQR